MDNKLDTGPARRFTLGLSDKEMAEIYREFISGPPRQWAGIGSAAVVMGLVVCVITVFTSLGAMWSFLPVLSANLVATVIFTLLALTEHAMLTGYQRSRGEPRILKQRQLALFRRLIAALLLLYGSSAAMTWAVQIGLQITYPVDWPLAALTVGVAIFGLGVWVAPSYIRKSFAGWQVWNTPAFQIGLWSLLGLTSVLRGATMFYHRPLSDRELLGLLAMISIIGLGGMLLSGLTTFRLAAAISCYVRHGATGLDAPQPDLKHLRADLESGMLYTRLAAEKHMAALGPAAVPELLDLLQTGDTSARTAAITVLGEIADPRAVPALIDCLRDECRLAVEDLEGYTASQARADHLPVDQWVLHSEVRRRRLHIIYALESIGDPAAIPLIVECFSDPEPAVRERAAQALGHFGEEGLSILRDSLKNEDWRIRRIGVKALGQARSSPDVPVIAALLADPSRHVQKAAVAALKRIGAEESIALVAEWETQSKDIQPSADEDVDPMPPEPFEGVAKTLKRLKRDYDALTSLGDLTIDPRLIRKLKRKPKD